VWALLALAALAGLFLVGYLPKVRRQAALALESKELNAAPRVRVTRPRRGEARTPLKLPGTVQAMKETAIYARTNGYLRRFNVDIGDKVKAGQVLADIDTPEVDQELLQARATLAQVEASLEQAKTDLEFARVSFERVQALAPAGVAPQQELDQRQAEYRAAKARLRVAEATIRANEANVHRLSEMKSFAQVVAPFAGTITQRTTEVGSLVMAGNGSGQALFRLAMTAPVRVFIDVPQLYASSVQLGQEARVSVREDPDRRFAGKVTHTAQALEPGAHTLLTEVQVPNEDGALLPGTYAQVELSIAAVRPVLLVDATALRVGAEGPTLALVGAGDRVHFQKVVIDADYGGEVGISSGVGTEDRVVLNPGERLSEGGTVTVVAPADK
jgi:RND family efflux transporter MFP subunit